MARDARSELERDNNLFHDETDADRRKQFAKSRKQTLGVWDIEIPNDYREVDHEKFQKVFASIQASGKIRERIQVTERNGRYILEDGQIRLKAARRLGFEEIKTEVLSEWRPKATRRKTPNKPLPNEWEIIQKAKAGDEAARNKIAEHYYRLATYLGAKQGKRKGLDFAETDSLAFEAICKAIETYDRKKGKFSTWVGVQLKGLVTRIAREFDQQGQSTGSVWSKTATLRLTYDRWVPDDNGPLTCGLAGKRYRRLGEPCMPGLSAPEGLLRPQDQWACTPLRPRSKRDIAARDPEMAYHWGRRGQSEWNLRELAERDRRQKDRVRYDFLAASIAGRRFDAWLARRKGVNTRDQKIARILFVDTVDLRWEELIGSKWYPCRLITDYLPSEVCEELGITASQLNAAIARIGKVATGKTEQELLAQHEARQARIAAIPVPEANIPRGLKKVLARIGREPSLDEAIAAVVRYWTQLLMRSDDRRARTECVAAARAMSGEPLRFHRRANPEWVQRTVAPRNLAKGLRTIACDVGDHIRGKVGPDYVQLARCVEIVKRHG